ncbi:hypothetical protein K1T71_006412 [Dendrolimus kikuchii]|uniref:Uncharacterized protein n=1 Tax=Dendrolimus kikuchii TaxID=765133 RepID=A0ACC1D0P2_9NEOP|nr:hypothetical protein K1T71_006412 [Dendrolimus kikuchii]
MLSSEMEGGRFKVYLFNITNADRFKSGEDEKLKLEEVGPFTYVEYRTHDLLEMDSVAHEMRYTPRMRSVFIPEESIARPEDVPVTMPNIPMLSATAMLRQSPYIVRSLFTLMAKQLNSKPIVTMNADKYLWGYSDPVLSVAHKVAPGLIHFNSTGVMDRLYDRSTEYRMTLGTADDNKFGIKSVKVLRKMKVFNSEDLAESISTFNDTYEGMAYPPKVTTETPINIYRVGICKSFAMEFSGRKTSEYGPNAFIYKFSNKTLVNEKLCDSKGSCPFGMLDMSSCFFGLPLGVTQGHFLGADPKLLDRIEGLSPDVDNHTSYIVIEPKIGLTLETSLSIQVNIVLGDIDYNSEVRRFSDMVLPIAHFKIKQPNLPGIAVRALKMMYITVPSALIIVEVVLFILGMGLLTYALKLYCSIWTSADQDTKTWHIINAPLIINK